MTEPHLRVQGRYVGRVGVEVGIFVAVDHLRRTGVLSAADEATYLVVDAWFDRELPNPPFRDDGNAIGAVTWFRQPVPEPMRTRVAAPTAILDRHGVGHDTVTSTTPGTVAYEDPWQVGVVPRERRAPRRTTDRRSPPPPAAPSSTWPPRRLAPCSTARPRPTTGAPGRARVRPWPCASWRSDPIPRS